MKVYFREIYDALLAKDEVNLGNMRTKRQHENPIKTAYDRMTLSSLEKSPSRSNPEVV